MYLTDINDVHSTELSLAQYLVAEALQGAQHTWGVWYYTDEEGAGDQAITESSDGTVVYWKINSSASVEEMSAIMRNVRGELAQQLSCSCQHDCCGCYFLSNMSAATLYETPNDNTYIIVENYGRNV